jgi:protein-ribulosamine 3-kinase
MHPLIARAFESKGLILSDLKFSGNVVTHSPTSRSFLVRTAIGTSIPQMRGEAAGLSAISMTSTALSPRLIALTSSEDGGEWGMISQYWDLGGSKAKSSPEMQRELARKIAGMHTPLRESLEIENGPEGFGYTGKFGFGVPTHCGISQLDNTWEEDWEVFYRDRRLGDVVARIGDEAINAEWEKMKERWVHIFDSCSYLHMS